MSRVRIDGRRFCEAAVQERTGWGFFHRCANPAKGERPTQYGGEMIAVCGVHLRGGSPIKYVRR